MRRATVLMLVIVSIMVAALIWDYFVAYDAYIYVAAFFSVGIVSFFGFLFLSRDMRTPVGQFEDADMRLAIAASFVSLFFAMLTFFMFSPSTPSSFAKTLIDTFLGQTALVVAFYFATSGALEYVKIRSAARERSGAPGSEEARGESSASEEGHSRLTADG